MPLPKSIAGDITDQLNAIKDASQLNQMAVQRLKSSIEKVKAVDIAQYYMLYGMLYSLLGDIDKSVEAHEKSIWHAAHPVMLCNYGFSMKRFGFGQKSFELMLKAFETESDDDTFEVTIAAAINGGIFDNIDDVVERFSKLYPGKNIRHNSSVQHIYGIRKKLAEAHVSEADYKAAFKVAESVLARHGFMVTLVDVNISSFDKVPYLSVEISMPLSKSEEIVSIQDQIADSMVASDIQAWDRVIFTVAPTDDSQAA